MKKLFFYFKRKFYKITRNFEKLHDTNLDYYRYLGVKIGHNTKAYSPLITLEPYLLTIGNNVTIAGNVNFITHDNSAIKIYENCTDFIGEIKIEDNCFIGFGSIILPGVIIGKNTIVAAGSVVTKSFPTGNVVIGGNPARIISSVEELREKNIKFCFNTQNMSIEEKKNYILINRNKLLKK